MGTVLLLFPLKNQVYLLCAVTLLRDAMGDHHSSVDQKGLYVVLWLWNAIGGHHPQLI